MPAKKDEPIKDQIDIDGYYVREVRLAPPEGAPFGEIRLVIRRATNALNLRIDQSANRLLAHMRKVGRDVDHPALRRYANNFCACVAQTLAAEGISGMDDWDAVKLGMGDERLLAAFDRWLELDGPTSNQWVNAIATVDAPPKLAQDPNARAPASGAG